LTTTLNITVKIAEVVAHLHARGVMHGDLYAHNILCNEHGNCLLGDFGAASFIPQDDVRLSTDLQCIEVRAFACLLEELLDRCESTFKSQHVFDSMRTLQWRCAQPEVNERPLFDEIQSELKTIQELYTAQ
jgi:serine/threonine protein kinase